MAAVRFGDGPAVVAAKGNIKEGLDQLEKALGKTSHVIGHNILRHDIEHLLAARPHLLAKMAAPIDTLWLNPLAFPRNPYHHLVKHYHDGRLQAGHVNDPELDARLVFQVLENQIAALTELGGRSPDTLLAYHYLATRMDRAEGFDAVFSDIRKARQPDRAAALAAIRSLLAGKACGAQVGRVLDALSDPRSGWPMAYALAWISVAGGESVMPPWVRAAFPQAALIVRDLRDTNCGDAACGWCAEMNDPVGALRKWFGFDGFRPQPADADGRPLQQVIVAETMGHGNVLGILPTGTGKSVCYQVPALSLYDKTGALTVVISPLVALMADQVQGMERAGISSAVTINGMLSMPERQEALDRVRLGRAAILLISPEQLRSVSVRSVLAQREVGLWVLDEAHCVSKWGHDFRPDYRYIGRFIREFSGDATPAPVLCLTATAKPEVVRDITEHFRERLGVELGLFDGGATRTNLTFSVLATTKESKLGDILATISERLPRDDRSGAVVYCATRAETERIADFLKRQGLAAEHFHAGLTPDDKQAVQERFRVGDLRVIAATNAFGMGIDKPDIRLVLHADIPGSLENYLQEAGRAGRDRDPAECVLLYHADDVERQFTLTARSRLERHEIGAILKALRRIDEHTRNSGKVVATAGEIVREEKDRAFVRDSVTDDTRVKTAISWLEEATLISREENRVQVFPSSLLVRSLAEAEARLTGAEITRARRDQLLSIVRHVMNTPPDHPGRPAGGAARRRADRGVRREGHDQADGAGALVAARAAGDDAGQGPDGVPLGHDHPPEAGARGLYPKGLPAAGRALPRADPSDPRDGRLRRDGAGADRRGRAPVRGLLRPRSGQFPAPLDARPRHGTSPADHRPGVEADLRGSGQPGAARDRRRRPRGNQRAGAGGAGIGQDAGARPSHRLSAAGET
ncbi:RecQ family ATP-dependent DNA helicase [Cereibacter ovatus]|uniref:RecQ family ATP-dependent DNA helicase n=1 Tax=Cereibacter ovatus TaxID=439529 RepID=A0A285CVA7_9RHOB|nr:RecQ family ATP-dependent DNA helicase [Cereibacter ovatus]